MNVLTGKSPIFTQKSFKGLWSRGSYESCPPDHLTDCCNCIFPNKDEITIRESVTTSSVLPSTRSVLSYFIAQPKTGVVLLTLNANGDFWNETANIKLGNIPGADDFTGINVYGRTYLSFKSKGKALVGDFVYFFDGIQFKKAAGKGPVVGPVLALITPPGPTAAVVVLNIIEADPTALETGGNYQKINIWTTDPVDQLSVGATLNLTGYSGSSAAMNGIWPIAAIYEGTTSLIVLTAVTASTTVFSVAPGTATINVVIPAPVSSPVKIDSGTHGVAYSYLNNNGYLSPPSPITYIEDPNQFDIAVSGISTGPIGTVGRVILMTKGNEIELFFVPDGSLDNNSQTTFTLSVFDTSLIESADYLIDILMDLPSCSAIKFYKGRLVLIGPYPYPDDVLVSEQLSPETFNPNNNIAHLPVDYGFNNANTALVIRDVLYVLKPNGTYALQDNGNQPSTWPVTVVDSGLGAWDDGVSLFASSMSAQDILDSSFIASQRGLIVFNGSYSDPPLTWKIQSLWDLIDITNFYKVQVTHDIFNKRVYIAVPLTPAPYGAGFQPSQSGSVQTVFMMDYQDGLDPMNVKWSVWTSDMFLMGAGIQKMEVENFTNDQRTIVYQLSFCNGTNVIYKIIQFAADKKQRDPVLLYGDIDSGAQQHLIQQYIFSSEIGGGDGISVFLMLNLSVTGNKNLSMYAVTKDRNTTFALGTFLLPNYSYREVQRLFNVTSETIQVGLRNDQSFTAGLINGKWIPIGFFTLKKMSVYGTKIWAMNAALTQS